MQSGSPIENVRVYRQDEFRFAPSYSVEMTESAVQIFRQKTDALHADETRMSFAIKSPGVGVILSPQLILQMDWEIKCPAGFDYRQALGPIYQALDGRASAEAAASETTNDEFALGYTPKLCFGEGDAVFNQLTSYSLVVNGASVSNHSQNLYKRSLDQCQIPDSVWRTRWCMAGGQYQKYDSVAVSGEAHTAESFSAAGGARIPYGADAKVVAFTADSGVQSRVEGLLGCITGVKAVDGGRDVYKVTVRAPVQGCGVFNPLAPDDDCATSCPLQRSLYALAHMNNIQLDFLFENLKQGLFRNLTGRGGAAGGFQVRLMGSGNGEVAPQIHSRWIRLSSYRSIPDVITCSTFRNTVHRATDITAGDGAPAGGIVPAALLEGNVSVKNAILPSGIGRRLRSRCAPRVTDRYIEVEWRAIQAAQPPQYLFFTMQKDARIFCLENDSTNLSIADFDTIAQGAVPAAGDVDDGQRGACLNQFYARNTASNAAILNFSLEIQSSVGAYTFASDTEYPFIKTKFELWRDHLKNTCKDYCSNDINIWQKNNSCLLLHACDWLRGLTTTNCAFPIQINAVCRFENKREFIDGAAASSAAGVTPVLHDIIAGEPVMVMLYPNTSLTLTASSGAASAANFSHSAGLDLLSRKV